MLKLSTNMLLEKIAQLGGVKNPLSAPKLPTGPVIPKNPGMQTPKPGDIAGGKTNAPAGGTPHPVTSGMSSAAGQAAASKIPTANTQLATNHNATATAGIPTPPNPYAATMQSQQQAFNASPSTWAPANSQGSFNANLAESIMNEDGRPYRAQQPPKMLAPQDFPAPSPTPAEAPQITAQYTPAPAEPAPQPSFVERIMGPRMWQESQAQQGKAPAVTKVKSQPAAQVQAAPAASTPVAAPVTPATPPPTAPAAAQSAPAPATPPPTAPAAAQSAPAPVAAPAPAPTPVARPVTKLPSGVLVRNPQGALVPMTRNPDPAATKLPSMASYMGGNLSPQEAYRKAQEIARGGATAPSGQQYFGATVDPASNPFNRETPEDRANREARTSESAWRQQNQLAQAQSDRAWRGSPATPEWRHQMGLDEGQYDAAGHSPAYNRIYAANGDVLPGVQAPTLSKESSYADGFLQECNYRSFDPTFFVKRASKMDSVKRLLEHAFRRQQKGPVPPKIGTGEGTNAMGMNPEAGQ